MSPEAKMPDILVKFDLAADQQPTELRAAARKAAAPRVAIVVQANAGQSLAGESLGCALAAEYAAILVPGLDGTELLVVSKSRQAAVEQAIGFAKTSAPVLLLAADRLRGARATHPLTERPIPITLDARVSPGRGSGAELLGRSGAGPTAKINEADLIGRLRESGHWLAEAAQ